MQWGTYSLIKHVCYSVVILFLHAPSLQLNQKIMHSSLSDDVIIKNVVKLSGWFNEVKVY